MGDGPAADADSAAGAFTKLALNHHVLRRFYAKDFTGGGRVIDFLLEATDRLIVNASGLANWITRQ